MPSLQGNRFRLSGGFLGVGLGPGSGFGPHQIPRTPQHHQLPTHPSTVGLGVPEPHSPGSQGAQQNHGEKKNSPHLLRNETVNALTPFFFIFYVYK